MLLWLSLILRTPPNFTSCIYSQKYMLFHSTTAKFLRNTLGNQKEHHFWLWHFSKLLGIEINERKSYRLFHTSRKSHPLAVFPRFLLVHMYANINTSTNMTTGEHLQICFRESTSMEQPHHPTSDFSCAWEALGSNRKRGR